MRTKVWRRFRPGNCDPGDNHEGAKDVVQDVREDENDDADGGGDQANDQTVDGRQAKLKHVVTSRRGASGALALLRALMRR